MNEARELLRLHHVEVDAGDHRTLDEIAVALGLTAAIAESVPNVESTSSPGEERKARRPYFAN